MECNSIGQVYTFHRTHFLFRPAYEDPGESGMGSNGFRHSVGACWFQHEVGVIIICPAGIFIQSVKANTLFPVVTSTQLAYLVKGSKVLAALLTD